MTRSLLSLSLCLIAISLWIVPPAAVSQDSSISAADLSAKLASGITDGSSITKLKMQIKTGSGNTSLNLQIKARRNQGKSQVLYQILFPTQRKGEAILLDQTGTATPGGYVLSSPDSAPQALGKTNLRGRAFNSDLSYLDLIENFFLWGNQNITGRESVNRIDCLILESKPGSKDSSPYGLVKSWIDPNRLVAMRVEKYDSSGNLLVRIDAKNVTKDDKGRFLPASFSIRRSGSGTQTELDGSVISHEVKLSDSDFTAQSMSVLKFSR